MKNIAGVLKKLNDKKVTNRKKSRYIPSAFLRTVHNTEEDFVKAGKLFDVASESFFNVRFNEKIATSKLVLVTAMALGSTAANFDETTELMKKAVEESDIRTGGKKFVEDSLEV